MSTLKTLLVTFGLLLLTLGHVLAQPVITTQPADQTNVASTTATFFVAATGTAPITNHWRYYSAGTISTNIPFETNATLVLMNVQQVSGRFAVVVCDPSGSITSRLAKLTVIFPPSITNQPSSRLAEVGDTVSFAASATGTIPLSYQWRLNDTNLAGKTSANLILTNVQFTNAGRYTVVVTNLAGATNSQVAVLTVIPGLFTKITGGPPVQGGGSSFNCAWGDYDGDGYEDLFVTNANGERNFLFHNNGMGGFTEITNGSIVRDIGDSHPCAWGDYDNDGHLDLFVGNGAGNADEQNFLYLNNGDGTFTRVRTGPIATNSMQAFGAAWGDFDNDGFIDLFAANYVSDFSEPNFAYHNSGDGSFTRVIKGVLVDGPSSGAIGCMWGDYDNDGRLDLFVPNANNQNDFLFLNAGGGAFLKITNDVVASDGRDSIGGVWGDYDNDGFLDLFVSCGNAQSGPTTNLLYHNNRAGGFERLSASMTINIGHHTGCAWGDYDNDGWLDLFVARASGENNLLYHNNGNGTFTPVTSGRLVNDGGNSFGAAWADYDNDGFLDLYVCNGGRPPAENNFLYRNNGNSNAWLKVKCVGTVSNRAAIGAKVRVRATIGGKQFWQMREISGGGAQGSQNSLIAHFGLGDATNADIVRIEWPSGNVQTFTNLAARQFLTITEPPRLIVATAGGQPQFTLKGGRNMSYDLQTSTNLADWSFTSAVTITNLNGATPIPVPLPSESPQQFYRAVLR